VSWPDPVLAKIAAYVSAQTGIAFPESFRPYGEAGIRHAVGRSSARSVNAYIAMLQTEPSLMQALITEVTVSETYFFRDHAQFEFVKNVALPQIASGKSENAPIFVWSAGCSSGEELYSLAMLAEELGIAERTRLLGTDISQAVVEKARRGMFGSWSFRDAPPFWRERCFTRSADRWEIAERFRERATFEVRNLVQPAGLPLTNVDLLFCRNVLMYFDASTIANVARMLLASLSAEGWLFTSALDPILPADLGLDAIMTPAGIAYRRPSVQSTARVQICMPERIAVSRDALSRAPATPRKPRRARSPGEKSPAALPVEPYDAEQYMIQALALLEVGAWSEAVVCARKAIYLDRSLAVAHFAFGRASRLLGNREAARRALRRVCQLVANLPEDTTEALPGGATAGELLATVAAELDLMKRPRVVTR
jgi:chemotaxis protein methyltransferase CheR